MFPHWFSNPPITERQNIDETVVSLTSHRKLVTRSTVQYLVTVDRAQFEQFSGSILSVVIHGNKTTDRDLIFQYCPGHSRSITIGTVSVGQNHYITKSLPAVRPVQKIAVWQSTHKSTPSLLIHKSSPSLLIHKSSPSVLIHKSSPP